MADETRAYKSDFNKKYYQKNNPFPVRLGSLKEKLQEEAFSPGFNSTIHRRVIEIIAQYFDKKDQVTP